MKKKLLRDILDFSQREKQALADDDFMRLERLTRRREEFIKEFLKVQNEFPEEEDEEYKQLIDEIKKLDAENIIETKRQMDEAKEELRKIRKIKRGTNNYMNAYTNSFASGQYFDRK